MEISLIIPTRNRVDILRRTLERTLAVTALDQRAEIIVVDNNSTDDTRRIVEGHQQQSNRIQYVHQERPGLLAGRHAGWRAAAGEIFLFLDDDVFISDNILDAYHELFSSPEVWLAGGNNWPLFEDKVPNWLTEEWSCNSNGEHVFPELSILQYPYKEPIEHDPFFVWGCNFAVRRTTLEAARGFHPDGYPDPLIKFRGDGESHVARFVQESGGRTMFNPQASVHHWVPSSRMTIDYMKKRAFLNGISSSYSRLRRKHAGKDGDLSLIDRIRYSGKKVANSIVSRKAGGSASSEPSIANLRDLIRYHETRGKLFHKTMFDTERAVREWTLRPDYIGGESPIAK